jgi:hypothetical protein
MVSDHRPAQGEIDEMDPRAGGAAERFETSAFAFRLSFQIGLNIHARLRASKNDEIRHRHRMPGR